MTPTAVVALNRAIALAEVRDPADALVLVDELDLDGYHLFHATRADFLRRLGRIDAAARAYARAAERAPNDTDRLFLQRRIAALGSTR